VSRPDWIPASIRVAGIERKLSAGQTLFRRGSKTVGLYQVVSGRVRLARVDDSGREAVLQSAVAGDTIAEASLFSPNYHCDAIATTNAVVRLYPKAKLFAEFKRQPETAQAFMAMLARQIMDLRTRLEQKSIQTARERLRHYLMLNVQSDGRTVALPGTIKELAGNLGLTHEALYRTLAKMQREGEIERFEGKIRLRRTI
jgi:CRP-like cAMP-binding protein